MLAVYQPDEKAKNLQGLLIRVDEVYTHCPRSLKFGGLWDTEEIERNQKTRPLPAREVS